MNTERTQPSRALPPTETLTVEFKSDRKRLAQHIQRDAASAKRTLEALTEAGLDEAHGNTRGRSYTLSAGLYRAKGKQVAYTRQAGFSSLQHEQMVHGHVRHHGRIQRSEVIELCHLTNSQAAKLLKRLKDEGRLIQHGERRWAFYTLGGNEVL